MPEYPYSDDMYSALDDSNVEEEPDQLYNVAAGLGLGDSSYRPGGPPQQQSSEEEEEEDEEEEAALSPSDGYFGRSDPPSGRLSTTAYPSGSTDTAFNSQRQHLHEEAPFNRSTSASVPRSSQVPHVPNIWVSDPSLEQGSIDKAREAQEERDQYQNRHLYNTSAYQHRADPNLGSSSLSSPAATGASSNTSPLRNPHFPAAAATGRLTAASPSSSSPSVAAHRYTPSHSSFSTAGRPHYPQRIYSERSSLFGDAPPAYTPSPTSPTSNTRSGTPHHHNYQTFSPTSPTAPGTSSNMGRLSESESHGLLAGQTYNAIPQSMSGDLDPNDDGHFEYPRPTSWKDRVRQFKWRKNWKLVLLGAVLTLITLILLVRSTRGSKEEVSSAHGPQLWSPIRHHRRPKDFLCHVPTHDIHPKAASLYCPHVIPCHDGVLPTFHVLPLMA